MKTLTITESKAQLSALVEQVVTTGQPVTIGRAGKPMVQLVPFSPKKSVQRLGAFSGKVKLAKNYKEWSDEEARAFGMEE